jgi:hypothetical protein
MGVYTARERWRKRESDERAWRASSREPSRGLRETSREREGIVELLNDGTNAQAIGLV